MATIRNIINVNNGNVGWTTRHVFEALEQVYLNVGYHTGPQKRGSLKEVVPPGKNWNATAVPRLTADGTPWTAETRTFNFTSGASAYVVSQTGGTGTTSGNNPDIVCYTGDTLVFNVDAANDPLHIVWYNTNGYEQSKEIKSGNFNGQPSEWWEFEKGNIVLSNNTITKYPNLQGVNSGTITWDTTAVLQGTYYYISANNPAKTGKIIINPRRSKTSGIGLHNTHGDSDRSYYGYNYYPDWYLDYTVPSSGTRSAATFRIYRNFEGYCAGIDVLNASSTYGWSDDEAFTIPGNQIGGQTPTHDIVFGASTETGKPYVRTVDLAIHEDGSSLGFWHKNFDEGWAILKVTNNATKKYGTTYYGITRDGVTLEFCSSVLWRHENTRAEGYTYSPTTGPGNTSSYRNYNKYDSPGYFGRVVGVDYSANRTNLNYGGVNIRNRIRYCRDTDPTDFPLQIRYYKAQSPQDTNFVIIQFTALVNGNTETYGTFFLHKGPNYGNGIWDLDYVFQGGMTALSWGTYSNYYEYVEFNSSGQLGNKYDSYYSTNYDREIGNNNGVRREALWGYERDWSNPNPWGLFSTFGTNISTNQENQGGYSYKKNIQLYYRNSETDDKPDSYEGYLKLSASSNYIKVFKGLPLATDALPIPYYLPDDFVIIQFISTPGSLILRPGDEVVISASEKYEIIAAGYNNNIVPVGYSGNQTRGMIFAARK